MYNTYTTQDLVDNVILTSHVPTANQTFSPANIVNLADRELKTPIIKLILSSRGNYYMTYADYPSVTDGLYDIPVDCIAGALANVELVQNDSIIQVNPLEEQEQWSITSPSASSYGYFMRGNKVQILPTPSVGSVRLWYYQRPSQLVLTTACAQITEINLTDITVSALPTSIHVGSTIDFLGDQPPFNILSTQVITNIVGMVITVAEEVVGLSVGDWIGLNKQTCVPQIPVEFRILLEQRTVVKIYKIQGIEKKIKEAVEDLKELEANTLSMITNRVKSKTAIINPVNGGFSNMRGSRFWNFPASGNQ